MLVIIILLRIGNQKGIDTSDSNIAEQLKNHSIGKMIGDGNVTEEIANDKLFGKNANNFKTFLNKIVKAIATLKGKLWGDMGTDFQRQAESFSNGDWSVVECADGNGNKRRTIETQMQELINLFQKMTEVKK